MTISLSDVGKRFNREWIFRHFSYQFQQGQSYAITGPNGSGKSTLLQVLSGSLHFNEGICKWAVNAKEVNPEEVFSHVSICAPYLELVEEMNLHEFFDFHKGFKPFLDNLDNQEIIKIIGLEKSALKQIRYYSSGMKQRVKLAQAIFSDTHIVLLDEPCTNLDITGINLYHQLINDYCLNRLVIVSSNDEVEYKFCQHHISILDYKK